ncbi:sensor histidine kinase [Chitinimonas sp.]|uniref:sensor histidine kinase n=1 Tax=Chitinimonas sp. TaxID=1934313 RepID=UPI002F91F588
MNQPKTALAETADALVARWQSLIDLLAFHAQVPCAMINRAEPAEHTLVFQTVNGNGTHGYTAGQSIDLSLNSYCANVLKRREPLLIKDARLHREMADNPTACLGMIFYYGLPIRRANGELFGTLCILDSEPRSPDSQVTGLMEVFRTTLENDLALVEQNHALGEALQREQAANRALGLANDQLAATNQTLDAFAYSISHDLRAPLRRINRFAELLLEDEASCMSSEGQSLLGRISDNAGALDALVGTMLEFAHGSKRSLERQPVDMAALARQVGAELGEDYPSCRFHIDTLPGCEGDATLLKQVWHNLMGNAAKYSSKQTAPYVQIYAEPWQGHQSYVVKDNGVGFDPERATELFEPFKRLHEEADFQGKGIGLAFVQRVVQRHGGDVIAESDPGQGATFRFWLA